MITRAAALCLVITLATTGARAQAGGEAAPAQPSPAQSAGTLIIPKDPLIAMYLSATLPGLGQIYAGQKTRGVLFMASVLGAFGAAYAAYKPADLALADYDKAAYGGNGDGFLSTVEAQNWEDRKFQDTAFERLSDGRKAGVITGAAVGAGLYLWNILNARHAAQDYNRRLAQPRVNVALDAGAHRLGLVVGMHF